MNRRLYRWWLLLLLWPLALTGTAQTNWRTILSAGFVAGETEVKPFSQLSAGLRFQRYFIGLGAGYDPYRFRSLPVFADLRVGFGRQQPLFLYANGGYNLAMGHEEEKDFFRVGDDIGGGLYLDAGLGYHIPVSGARRLSFSAGYSRKDITRQETIVTICLVPPCQELVYNYKYQLGRLIARLSWEFGH